MDQVAVKRCYLHTRQGAEDASRLSDWQWLTVSECGCAIAYREFSLHLWKQWCWCLEGGSYPGPGEWNLQAGELSSYDDERKKGREMDPIHHIRVLVTPVTVTAVSWLLGVILCIILFCPPTILLSYLCRSLTSRGLEGCCGKLNSTSGKPLQHWVSYGRRRWVRERVLVGVREKLRGCYKW